MDREKIKAAKAEAQAAQETKVSDVFPTGRATLCGKEWPLSPLTFRDIRDIEREYQDFSEFLNAISLGKASANIFYLFLHLRRSAGSLTLDDASAMFFANPDESGAALLACVETDRAIFPNAEREATAETEILPAEPTGSESSAN